MSEEFLKVSIVRRSRVVMRTGVSGPGTVPSKAARSFCHVAGGIVWGGRESAGPGGTDAAILQESVVV